MSSAENAVCLLCVVRIRTTNYEQQTTNISCASLRLRGEQSGSEPAFAHLFEAVRERIPREDAGGGRSPTSMGWDTHRRGSRSRTSRGAPFRSSARGRVHRRACLRAPPEIRNRRHRQAVRPISQHRGDHAISGGQIIECELLVLRRPEAQHLHSVHVDSTMAGVCGWTKCRAYSVIAGSCHWLVGSRSASWLMMPWLLS